MDKTTRNKIIVSISLFALLATSRWTIDKVASNANQRIISWGQKNTSEVQLVAHRGYSSMYPDNSLEGLLACNDMKCISGIECDVRLTKDNRLILMHNDFIGFRPVESFTFDELSSMDLSGDLASRTVSFKGYNIKEQAILAKRYEKNY